MSVSAQLFNQARKVMPGGVNSPVRAFRSVNLDPVFIASGKGCKIIDVDGKEYIDFVGSWGPLILGHAHEEVLEAIRETAKRGTSFGAPTHLEIRLAEKIIQMVPSVEMVRMVNSGTEATMSAIRLARGYTDRDQFIKFEGCYHGHGDSFLIKAGSGALTLGEPNSPGVTQGTARDTLNARFNDLASVRQLFEETGKDIAAIIVEPIAGNMGVIPPLPGFLEGLRALCDQYGSLLILDEVMTGFRVHPGGAQTLFGIQPDLTTMGKVIGGGLPVAAYGGKKEVMEAVSPSGSVYQAGTLSGNPLAMAAGLKTLEILSRPGFYEDLNRKSEFFFTEVERNIEENALPLTVNHVGSMGCLFFKEGTVETFEDTQQADTEKFAQYFGHLLQKGIYIAPSQFEATFISAAHSDDDLITALDAMSDSLRMVFA
ncbi:MAG: glutamate-1-semialdehyde 2,1-aminomutase [Candidatus Latescibacterota bacterium]